ncbi:hypothetical protein FRB90_011430 [Tulasnella sp. 427]|nr:hypothetical protein FRB90_011430 [Tulasnella sp. 427]
MADASIVWPADLPPPAPLPPQPVLLPHHKWLIARSLVVEYSYPTRHILSYHRVLQDINALLPGAGRWLEIWSLDQEQKQPQLFIVFCSPHVDRDDLEESHGELSLVPTILQAYRKSARRRHTKMPWACRKIKACEYEIALSALTGDDPPYTEGENGQQDEVLSDPAPYSLDLGMTQPQGDISPSPDALPTNNAKSCSSPQATEQIVDTVQGTAQVTVGLAALIQDLQRKQSLERSSADTSEQAAETVDDDSQPKEEDTRELLGSGSLLSDGRKRKRGTTEEEQLQDDPSAELDGPPDTPEMGAPSSSKKARTEDDFTKNDRKKWVEFLAATVVSFDNVTLRLQDSSSNRYAGNILLHLTFGLTSSAILIWERSILVHVPGPSISQKTQD